MNSDTQQTGRRRGGRRRPRGGRPSQHRSGSSASSSQASAGTRSDEKKPGFLKRIFGILFGKKPETPGSVYGRVIDTPQPREARPPRQPRPASNGNGPASRVNENETPEAAAPAPAAPRPPRQARKPELVEVSSPKLYVGNLSFDAAESDLGELFGGVGTVQASEVVCHRETQRSKGFAFVTMASVEEARRAVEVLHDKEFMGRKLVVSGAKTSDVR